MRRRSIVIIDKQIDIRRFAPGPIRLVQGPTTKMQTPKNVTQHAIFEWNFRGLIGLINGFASKSYRGSNNVVIAHELMHTLGATDKYNQLNLPTHPGGFAAPFQEPLFPQRQAEIMGGRIPVSATQAIIPNNLGQVVVGAFTAAELNWYRE